MMATKKGFTLIEILIALAVFAILASLTSSVMYYAFNTRSRVNEQADRLTDLQLVLSLLSQDTTQIINRAIRSNEMHLVPAFIGQPNYVEFTRGGLVNPESKEKRATLARVGFACQGDELVRRTWDVLDDINHQQYHDKVLLSHLADCQWAYLDNALQVLTEWRASNVVPNQPTTASPTNVLPKAIRLSITLKQWGSLSYLFPLPVALYGHDSTSSQTQS